MLVRIQRLNHIILITLIFAGLAPSVIAKEAESQFKVPVIPVNIPAGILVTGPPFQGIEIHVRGSEELLHSLPELKLQYILDLADLGTGSHTLPVQFTQLSLPEGLTVLEVQPHSIQVHLEAESLKEVPVTVFFSGDPASGYFVADTSATPAGAILRGPKQVLDKVDSVSTLPIDVTGASESFKKEITLDLDENIEVMTPKTPILVEVTIRETIVTKIYPDVIVQGNDEMLQYEISPPTITMQVKGPSTLLAKMISTKEFKVYVDLKGLDPGVYVRRAALELPVGTTLISVSPEIFTVKILSKKKKQ